MVEGNEEAIELDSNFSSTKANKKYNSRSFSLSISYYRC